jgi:hypothetical protein
MANLGAVARLRSPRHSIIGNGEIVRPRVQLALHGVFRGAADMQPPARTLGGFALYFSLLGALADADISPRALLCEPR